MLAVHADRQQITIRHDDVPGLMPGMTMTFPVASKELLSGRTPGELVSAQLEIAESEGTLTGITRVGMAALPAGTNEVALASGILGVGDPLPDVALIDQTDRRRSLAEWHGAPVLITFAYTRCPLPTFCPLMDQNFATIQRGVDEDAILRGRVKLISISLDPDHDTPAVLAAHAARLRADPAVWTFLTGDRVTIDRLAGRFGVGVMRNPAVATDITHNLRTVLAGPDGRVARIYSSNEWTPGTVLTDLRALLRDPGDFVPPASAEATARLAEAPAARRRPDLLSRSLASFDILRTPRACRGAGAPTPRARLRQGCGEARRSACGAKAAARAAPSLRLVRTGRP